MTAPGLQLGAPGIYPAPPRRAEPSFRPVRLDVTGFVGVAPRGPVNEPVPVESWSDYLRRFGGFRYGRDQHPWRGRLPFAVQAFFAQGGAKAYVVRVAPVSPGKEPDPAAWAARARHRIPLKSTVDGATGAVELLARDEGSWGNRVTVRLEFDVTPQFDGSLRAAPADAVPGTDLPVPDGVTMPAGTLLRLRRPDLPPAGVFRWVTDRVDRPFPGGGRQPVAVLDRPLSPSTEDGDTSVAVVTATVVVTDADPEFARQERLTGVGLRIDHPRFIRQVLVDESLLVAPADGWPAQLLPPDPLLLPVTSEPVHDGVDRHDQITGGSFFDADPDKALDPGAVLFDDDDPLDESSHRGVDAMVRVTEIGLLAVPDLAWTWTPTEYVTEPAEPAGDGTFQPCRVAPPPFTFPTVVDPEPVLDGRDPAQLQRIVNRQLNLVARADLRRRFVVLLDVPSRLSMRSIGLWRARFDSSYAAAYHPWLGVVRTDDPRQRVVLVPPSAFAAGIIAARELRFGIPFGPANELAVTAVTAADPVTDADHDRLHLLGINVYRAERDGFRLTAARTVSSDRDYRQLNVRRLITMLRLALDRQSQWMVFEPSTPDLQVLVRHTLTQFLRELYRRGAFVGDTEQDAFFVHCDSGLNPPDSLALGRLIAEVGVAPAEPVEYIVLRISQNADGVVTVEADRG